MKTIEQAHYTEWLKRFMSGLTAEKNAGQIAELSAAVEQALGTGLYTASSLTEQEQLLRRYARQEGLSKEQQKVLMYFRSYVLLEQTDDEAEEMQQDIEIRENAFDCWLHLENSLSTPLIRTQTGLIKLMRESGMDLLTCRTLRELKAQALSILNDTEDKHITRTITRICAYACTCLQPYENNEQELQPSDSLLLMEKDYTRWCIMRGGTKNTVRQQTEYVERVAAYMAEKYNCADLESRPAEEAMQLMLQLYSDCFAHEELLSTQGERGYADLYCSYLMEKIDLDALPLPQDAARNTRFAPLLITGDKRSIIAEYKDWVMQTWNSRGARVSPGSLRTFASSIYNCNSILQGELGETEYDLFNPHNSAHAALLKHKITRAKGFRGDHGGALWSYIAFLAHRTILNTDAQQAIREKLVRLLEELTDGCLPDTLPPSLAYLWQETYDEHMPEAKDLLEQITDEITIRNSKGQRLLPKCLLSPEERKRLEEYIRAAFNSGCPVVDFEQILAYMQFQDSAVNETSLRRYLEITAGELCACDKNHIRKPDTEKQTYREIAAYVCEVIRGFQRPVSPEELREALPYLSEATIQTTFSRNELGWNIGLVNPKRKHVFHADIIHLTEEEVATITLIIYKHVEQFGHMSSGQLHQTLSSCNLAFIAERDYMDIAALYSTIRFKLKNIFNFNSSFITMRRDESEDGSSDEDVNTKSVFLDFCKEHESFTLEELLGLASKLGKTTIPFADIYNTVARVTFSQFVQADKLEFDVDATDAALLRHCSKPYTLLTELMRKWQAPPVSGYEWTPHLMQYYLCFKSKRFRMLIRVFAKRAALNGFIMPAEHEVNTFEAAVAAYLAAQKELPLQEEPVLDFLLDRALIGARRFKELADILQAASKLRGESTISV